MSDRAKRFVDGPDELKAALLDVAKGFNPDQPRDEDGRWTSGGLAFASPSVHDKDFAGAASDLTGQRQALFERAGNEIDDAMGVRGTQAAVIGAWSDGAENSTLTEAAPGTSPEALRMATVMKGALAQQKAVLVFSPDPAGPAAAYDLTVKGSAAETHAQLLKAEVPFHTLIPMGTSTRVLVVDTDGSLGKNVGDFAVAHGTQAKRISGNAEFIGDSEGSGSDAEQRGRAQAEYERVIAASPASGNSGRSAGEVWSGIRDRWNSRLAAQKRALTFGEALAKLDPAGSLYVHRPLQNADRLHRWAQRAGITNLVPPEEMHVTQVYSRDPVALEPRTDTVTATGGARGIAPLGDKGAVVLHFKSPELQARHQEAMAAGASHDFPSYLTHVTLAYGGNSASDLAGIAAPTFPLEFGPEVHSEINDNWAEEKGLRKAVGMAAFGKRFAKDFDPSQPRDDYGRWTDGSGADRGVDRDAQGPDLEESVDEDVAWERMAAGLQHTTYKP